ncbi:uncharacterized protein LOC135847616 isoform X1 [Planococcus citri]|uniref:uncharacterized protein LOC135847616 isoform X1 n=1 Tax=Planococcus citri TaxID=170843 RepID=UPI0031F9AE5B
MEDYHSSDNDSYSGNSELPSLLQLSLDLIIKRLWMSEINRDWFETKVLNCKRLKSKLQQNRDPIIHSLPPSIKQMLIDNIDRVGMQMNKRFSNLSGFGLLVCVFRERKFRDFAPLIWNFVIEENVAVNYFVAQKIFAVINEELNKGSIVIPSEEVSFYLRMWRSFPKRLRSRLIVCLSYIDQSSYYKLKNDCRDLRFFTELIIDFDAAERKKIWMENYAQLIVGANPSTLEDLMRLCFDNEEQIIEFKREYFVKNGRADSYCSRLIGNRFFAELDRFLSFCCQHDELEAEELTKRILHKHFATYSIAEGYDVLFQILGSNAARICRVIKLPEFQHLFHMPTENLKEFCYSSIDKGDFEELIEFLEYFFPPERDVSCFLQEAVKSFFTDRVVHGLKYSNLLRPKKYENFLYLKKLNSAIENLFSTSEAAACFKKEIMFCDGLFDLVRNIMLSCEKPFRELSPDGDRMIFVKEFVNMFLSSEQDLSKWKEDFVADSIKNMRCEDNVIRFQVSDAEVDWVDAKAWFLDSDEKVSQFKASFPMDEILSIYLNLMSDEETRYLDNILLWYYSNDEEQIVFFKLQRLRECIENEYPEAREALLGSALTEFDNCTNDFDRCEVLRRALGREDEFAYF